MTKYLISFPGAAMQLSPEEFEAAGRDAHAVTEEAKAAGVYVFGGGIDESVPPVQVDADGAITGGAYSQFAELDGGHCVLELPDRAAALEWAAKIARACRCPQEVREFGYDPAS